MSQSREPRVLDDARRPAWGLGRLMVVMTLVTGLVTFLPALVHAIRHTETLHTTVLTIVVGVAFLVMSVALAHNGRRMRWVGWASLAVSVIGVVVANCVPTIADQALAWWGVRLWFLPVLTPVLAGVWLWWSDPRRIVVTAERLTDRARR